MLRRCGVTQEFHSGPERRRSASFLSELQSAECRDLEGSGNGVILRGGTRRPEKASVRTVDVAAAEIPASLERYCCANLLGASVFTLPLTTTDN
jgi:hypothetical protein